MKSKEISHLQAKVDTLEKEELRLRDEKEKKASGRKSAAGRAAKKSVSRKKTEKAVPADEKAG